MRRLFELQGSFSDRMITPKIASKLSQLDAASPMDALAGGKAATAERDALDELAANFADVIEKAVDNQCRVNRSLGLPHGAAGSATALEPLSGPLTFEALFGPRLVAFGPHREMLNTVVALRTTTATPAAGAPVFVLFGRSRHPDTLTLATRLSALASPADARVVYVSLDTTKVEFDRFTAQRLPACWAVPFRERRRFGERARKLLHTDSVPALVVTQWAAPHATGAGSGCVEVLNEEAAHEVLGDERGLRFPWVRQPVEELLGEVLVRRDGSAVHRDGALQACDVLALYFGSVWCNFCKEFKPKAEAAHRALSSRGFEIVYVDCPVESSEPRYAELSGEAAFERYLRTTGWLGVPYARHDVRRALRERFRVEDVPTVLLFRRDPSQEGRFELLSRGRNGCELLTTQLSGYPWQLVLPLTQSSVLHELPGSAALVVLCEHLLPGAYELQQLRRTLETLAHSWQARRHPHPHTSSAALTHESRPL